MKHSRFFFWFVLLCLTVGCNSKVPLGGRVTFSDDGSPVTEGGVVFSTSTFQSRGMIGPDGTYSMSSTGNADGLPPGTYAVTLVGVDKTIPIPQKDGSFINTYEPLIDPKYASPATSGLTFTVDGNNNSFDIQVDRIKKSR